MAKKLNSQLSTFVTVFILTLLIGCGIIVAFTSSNTNSSSLNTTLVQSDLTDDSTPPLLQSDKGVILIAAIDKKTLTVSGVSIDYLIGNAEPESLEGEPMLVIEGYDLYGNPINDQPLPTDEHLTTDGLTPNTSSKKLNYWVVSTQLSLPLRTVYWQIRYVPSNKVIWKTNVHHFLLKQSLETMPVTHLVTNQSNKLIKDQIDKLEMIYTQADESEILKELSYLKELIKQETESNALKTSPLEIDQKDFLEILNNLHNSIETRSVE